MHKMQIRKAQRKQAKLRIGAFGPSGSGKTMGALKIGRGLTEWDKIVVIDTENNSADLYSHLGDYNVINITPPFTPEKYIETIEFCGNAGMEVIIIDSISHEWFGTGGILEIADDLSKSIRNSMQVWAKLTPRHNKFIGAILNSPCHVICCGRSKQDYVMNQVEKNGKTINVPEKVGLKAITRDGFDYEMTLSLDIAINHYASVSKDRTDLFMRKPDFVITEETGQTILEWNTSGAVNTDEQKREIIRQLDRIGLQTTDGDLITADILDQTGLSLKEENFGKIIDKLKEKDPIPTSNDDDDKFMPPNTEEAADKLKNTVKTVDINKLQSDEPQKPADNREIKPEEIPDTPKNPTKQPPPATPAPKVGESTSKPAQKLTEPKTEAPKEKLGPMAKIKKEREKKKLETMLIPEVATAYNRIQARVETDGEIQDDEFDFVNDVDNGKFTRLIDYINIIERKGNQ